jgi:hypothetical protein
VLFDDCRFRVEFDGRELTEDDRERLRAARQDIAAYYDSVFPPKEAKNE